MKKILMLTMSCNQPYFQALLGTVMDTWARPLIQNKYENITWFAYTACDNKHPKPCVDFKDHIIYVDSRDDLNSTYDKTRKAYEMIKDVVDFDYVVRTNTSVFVNVDRLIDYINIIDENAFLSNYSMCSETLPNGETIFRFFCLIGFFMGMKREYFEIGMSGDDNLVLTHDGKIAVEQHDDMIISQKLHNALGANYPMSKINPNGKVIMYKPCEEGEEDITKPYEKGFFFEYHNPDVINNQIMVRVRSLYNGEKRMAHGRELEHFYELNDALI